MHIFPTLRAVEVKPVGLPALGGGVSVGGIAVQQDDVAGSGLAVKAFGANLTGSLYHGHGQETVISAAK